MTRDTLENNREAIVGFLRGEIKGWQDYVADPTLAVDLTVNKYGADGGLTIEASRRSRRSVSSSILVTPTTIEHGLLWMSEDDIASNIATVKALGVDVDEDLFDTSLLEEIYQGGSSIE